MILPRNEGFITVASGLVARHNRFGEQRKTLSESRLRITLCCPASRQICRRAEVIRVGLDMGLANDQIDPAAPKWYIPKSGADQPAIGFSSSGEDPMLIASRQQIYIARESMRGFFARCF